MVAPGTAHMQWRFGAVAATTLLFAVWLRASDRSRCRPDVSCADHPELCAQAKGLGAAGCEAYTTPGAGPWSVDPDALKAVKIRLEMLRYIQERVPAYLDGGSHLGAIRNRSVIPSDGDLDIVIAPRYPSACRGGTWGLSQLWWYGDTLQEIDDILRRDLPKGWHLHKNTAYDFQLSLTPTEFDESGKAKCCQWPNVVDMNVESHCREMERHEMFGDGFCTCQLDDGFDAVCVRAGEQFAECQYGPGWHEPSGCTYSPSHPNKPHCEVPTGTTKCDHLWWYRCPFVPGYKWRHLGGWGRKFLQL